MVNMQNNFPFSSGSRAKPVHFHIWVFLERVDDFRVPPSESTPFKSLRASEHNKQF